MHLKKRKSIQRILYTLPDASHLTGIGFNRGYYHDRQNLGLWMPHGSSLQIRIVNAEEFQQDLTVQFKTMIRRQSLPRPFKRWQLGDFIQYVHR